MASNKSLPPADPGNSDLMNYVVRMVVPMRREFGRTLDVPHFLHDFVYAKEIIEQAKASRDERLRDYAAYLDSKMFGPRNAEAPRASPALPAVATPPVPAESKGAEAELRTRMLDKYKGGLR